jgi:hypothetical protein
MKEWASPELIVLVRSNSEEAVLVACKTFNDAGGMADGGGCVYDLEAHQPCFTVASS